MIKHLEWGRYSDARAFLISWSESFPEHPVSLVAAPRHAPIDVHTILVRLEFVDLL
jgi:hypothetical protein